MLYGYVWGPLGYDIYRIPKVPKLSIVHQPFPTTCKRLNALLRLHVVGNHWDREPLVYYRYGKEYCSERIHRLRGRGWSKPKPDPFLTPTLNVILPLYRPFDINLEKGEQVARLRKRMKCEFLDITVFFILKLRYTSIFRPKYTNLGIK